LLYLRRYWTYEQRIRAGIEARLSRPLTLPEDATRTLLDRLFAEENADTPPWQRIACALAARRAFAIVTGGPGTGKTTTVVRLLALLQGLALEAGGPPLRIRLAAPTGKAAARLNESIAGQVASLPFDRLPGGEDALRPAIPTQATTLHRLLGTRPDSRHFRYHAGQPLPADIVVVDEASMIDVELMAALLEALRPDARLIMLGDKDQLASVEAGAVLGDLCRHAREAHYTPQTRAWLEGVTGARLPEDLVDPMQADRWIKPSSCCVTATVSAPRAASAPWPNWSIRGTGWSAGARSTDGAGYALRPSVRSGHLHRSESRPHPADSSDWRTGQPARPTGARGLLARSGSLGLSHGAARTASLRTMRLPKPSTPGRAPCSRHRRDFSCSPRCVRGLGASRV
jgi:hypothetical protein